MRDRTIGAEILEILRRRLENDEQTELREAAEQQRQITQIRLEAMAISMKRISTHVLDLPRGKPAKDVPVRLDRREQSGNWVAVTSARTDQDGRCTQLLPDETLSCRGIYRLTFDTAGYFAAQRKSTDCTRVSKLRFRYAMENPIFTFRCC